LSLLPDKGKFAEANKSRNVWRRQHIGQTYLAIRGQRPGKTPKREEAKKLRPYQVEGVTYMADVIFPKRAPMPRELDTRPIASDYRPKRMRLLARGAVEDETYYGDELHDQDYSQTSPENSDEVVVRREDELRRPRLELGRDRLNEIATLMRSLTYGEMIELAQAIWNIKPAGEDVDQRNLPMMLHLWSTSSKQ
jgi:hypothetical protein